ncbi:uncharacterized protein DUF748 [Methylovorus glucosotrophus]|uniref:DUF748 domain-containing protein n=1 Tax=Methylovorus glucosotrophus TaxID=266009 RepID=UPI0013317B74|nr:DUF748 domain-containing protein [Methylovorus glucosotrophus]KAF0842735.1 uncharacterized protein DUF748 [Methylovorus glucosotrophus]
MLSRIRTLLLTTPFKIFAGVVIAYLLFAYLAVDPLARRILPWFAENKLASQASVEHVKFDPLRLILTIDQLKLNQKNGAPLASFDRLYVNLETSGLFRFAWRIKDIRLTAPHVAVEVGADGRLNWADLIAKLNEDKDDTPSTSMPRLLIDHILIEGGDVAYVERNRPQPFELALQPLGLELDGLSTLPEDRGDYLIVAKLPADGGSLKWKGDIGLNPLVSRGVLELQGIKLAPLMQIVKHQALPVRLTQGELQSRLTYSFAMVKGADQQDPTPEAIVQDLSLSLENVAAEVQGQYGPAQLHLKQVSVAMPRLDFSMRKGTELTFKNMRLGLQKLVLQQAKTPLFQLDAIDVQGIDYDLARQHLQVADAVLHAGHIKAARSINGSLDWQSLIPPASGEPVPTSSPAPEAAAAKQPFTFDIAHLHLADWRAEYRDASFVHPMDVALNAFNLELGLGNKDGKLQVRDIQSRVGPVQLKSALYAQPAATLSSLQVHDGAVDVDAKSVTLGAVVLSGLQAQVLRSTSQPLNWQAMLETRNEAASAPAVTSAPVKHKTSPASSTEKTNAAWKLSLPRLALQDASVHVEDNTPGKPVVLDIERAGIELQDVSLDLGRSIPVKAGLKIKQGGQFNADGKLTLSPFKADLKLGLDALSLKPLAPYINQFALLRLNDGAVRLNGQLGLKTDQAFSAQFKGGFAVDRLAIAEENGGATFLAWKTLGSDSLKLSLGPDRLHMDELRIVEPQGKFIIHEDKTLNVQRMMRTQPVNPPATAKANTPPATISKAPAKATSKTASAGAKDSSTFPVSISRVRIDRARLEFADYSLKPQFGTYINSLSGVINGLSTDANTTAQVELDGKVDEYGSARIRGSLQPFKATDFTDLKLTFRNLEMNRLTPYSGKFAGRRIESGKLSVDLEYKIKQRQMTGENKFVINKLRLGEHVDSPDAVNLPLDLAIALLEDSDGIIDLNLPVSGSLDDPQFSYGKVVWKAFVNVLGKIATAPFRALGNLLGIKSDKLEAVVFDPASAVLAPPEQEKLQAVANAMAKRPALTLTVTPAYDAAADRKALQEQAIRRDVAQRMGMKLAPNEQPGPVDLHNPKVRSAVFQLAQERGPDAKKRGVLGKLKDYLEIAKPEDPAAYDSMLQQLKDGVNIPDSALQDLANARAASVQQYLQQSAGLAPSRLAQSAIDAVSGDSGQVPLKLNLGVSR